MILDIPAEFTDALRLPREEQSIRLLRELAIRLYQKGLLSFGKARQLAGMSKWEFHILLGDEGIERSYDVEELESDLRTLEDMD